MLSIGDLATASGVPPTTLRYYDRIGLVVAGRGPGGRRRYPAGTVELLHLVRLLQVLGCSLDEVSAVVATDPGSRQVRRDMAARKLVDAERRLAELTTVTEVLRHLATCRHAPAEAHLCRAHVMDLVGTTVDTNGTP